MSTSASSKRQVLATFIAEVPRNKGWWFCLPTISSTQLPHQTDCCMPHLGVPFGMTKVAMLKILLSMECLWLLCGKSHMNVQGWEDLWSEFKVTAIKWGMSKIKSTTSATWYIQIGETQYPPTKLYSMWKQGMVVPPSIIGRRKAIQRRTEQDLSKVVIEGSQDSWEMTENDLKVIIEKVIAVLRIV
jgi:hypothetical protein